MKKKERKQLEKRLDQLESAPAKVKNKLDKMSLHFVIPLVAFYFIIGLLLILLNDLVTNVAAWALAVGLVLIGGWLLMRYFRASIQKRLAGADMAMGLVLLLAGVLLIVSPTDMKEVFPKIWGLSLIFGGFLKIQYAFDEKSVHVNRWWIMLIFAGVSLAIGVLALLHKSVFGVNQHLVVGIFMICEAVLDLVTYFLLSNGMKKQTEAGAVSEAASGQAETAPAEAEAPEAKPGQKEAAPASAEAEAPETKIGRTEAAPAETETRETKPDRTEEALASAPAEAETPETKPDQTETVPAEKKEETPETEE